ncbi:MAG TPA: hypothetical protein VFC06_00465 [Demequina sp.]|nr:hypothetical protein [Demequina sp.]
MSEPTLFDRPVPADHDTDTTIVHALMPWMGLACGGDVLTISRAGRAAGTRTITTHVGAHWGEVTCPDCLALGDLSALARNSQRPERLATVTP